MTIRTAKPSDGPALIALWTAAHLSFQGTRVEAELTSVLRLGHELVLVDTHDEMIVASVMGTFDGRRGWVNRLATHPNHEGHGHATALLGELETRLVRLGCEKINLLIDPDNAAVAEFYRRQKFTCDDLIFMEKWL